MVYDDGVIYRQPRHFIPIWSEDRKDPQGQSTDEQRADDRDRGEESGRDDCGAEV